METAKPSERQHRRKNRLRIRWLNLWREWDCPRFTLELSLSGLDGDGYEGHIGATGLASRFAGEPFEQSGQVLQSFKVFAFERDITTLIAELSGLPHVDGKVFVLMGSDRWSGMASLCMAAQAAHHDAAWHMGDIEALRAIDAPFISEEVALLESQLLSKSQGASSSTSQAFSTRSNPRRL